MEARGLVGSATPIEEGRSVTDPRVLLGQHAATTINVEDAAFNVDSVRLDAVAPRLFAALRAVLDVHKMQPPNRTGLIPEGAVETCGYCYERGDIDSVEWPCPTVKAIVRELEGK
jgi:hypothetical protein